MKKYLLVYLATLMSFTKPNQELIDRIGVKGPLTFNNTTFKFTWSQQNNNYYIQEYLPDGENADHFNQMLSIFLLAENIKTKDAVLQKISELKTRKKTDPTRNYILNQSSDGKEYMIDFVLGESKNDKMEVEEFNSIVTRKLTQPITKRVFLYTQMPKELMVMI